MELTPLSGSCRVCPSGSGRHQGPFLFEVRCSAVQPSGRGAPAIPALTRAWLPSSPARHMSPCRRQGAAPGGLASLRRTGPLLPGSPCGLSQADGSGHGQGPGCGSASEETLYPYKHPGKSATFGASSEPDHPSRAHPIPLAHGLPQNDPQAHGLCPHRRGPAGERGPRQRPPAALLRGEGFGGTEAPPWQSRAVLEPCPPRCPSSCHIVRELRRRRSWGLRASPEATPGRRELGPCSPRSQGRLCDTVTPLTQAHGCTATPRVQDVPRHPQAPGCRQGHGKGARGSAPALPGWAPVLGRGPRRGCERGAWRCGAHVLRGPAAPRWRPPVGRR